MSVWDLESGGQEGIVPRSFEEEEDKHEVSWKPLVGALRVFKPARESLTSTRKRALRGSAGNRHVIAGP